MPAAARIGDKTSHPGVISGPDAAKVAISGLPAAVVGSPHTCALPPAAGGPHPQTSIVTGSSSVYIGGRPAARFGDQAGCGALIVTGAPRVLIGG